MQGTEIGKNGECKENASVLRGMETAANGKWKESMLYLSHDTFTYNSQKIQRTYAQAAYCLYFIMNILLM